MAKREQQKIIFLGAKSTNIGFIPHYPVGQTLPGPVIQSLSQGEISVFIAVWAEVIGPLIPLLANRLGRNELANLNLTRRFRFELCQFLFCQKHKFPWLDFVTLLSFFGRNFFVRIRIHHVLLNSHMVRSIENMKMDGAIDYTRIKL